MAKKRFYDPLKQGQKPDAERRDADFSFPDEITDEQERTVRELMTRAVPGSLAIVGSPQMPGKAIILMVSGELAISQLIGRADAITIARQLLDFVGIESMIAMVKK